MKPLIPLLALQLGDILSTNYALSRSGVYESNPVVAHMQQLSPDLWWVVKLPFVLSLLAIYFYLGPTRSVKGFLTAATAIYAIVVLNNVLGVF